MPATRDEIIVTARSYLGVPYQHQGRGRAGIDCAGLLVCTGRDMDMNVFDFLEYRRDPDPETLEAYLDKNLERLPDWKEAKRADILVIRYAREMPKHTMIVTYREGDEFKVIHARPNYGVIEHRLDEWWFRKVHSGYTVPGIVD